LNPTTHATVVLTGATAVLIRGPSGAGKSRLAFDLLRAAEQGALPFARLVADDRVYLEAHNGRLLAQPPSEIAGLIEVHGLGIRRVPFEPLAVVRQVIDLAATDAARHPEPSVTTVAGITLPRLAVAAGMAALPLVLAILDRDNGQSDRPRAYRDTASALVRAGNC